MRTEWKRSELSVFWKRRSLTYIEMPARRWACGSAAALPDDFGDWQREYFLAKQSVALVDKSHRAYISFTGPDRARYLNAILTNNIKDLQPSQGCISLLLNPQGRILAEIETRDEPRHFSAFRME